jgi:splicing factor 1
MANIPADIDPDQFEILIRKLPLTIGKYRLDDISMRLNTNDWENADPDLRSPSPEPTYDSRSGKRLNTREVRTKEKYIKEKHSLIEELIILDTKYTPPIDYRPPKKIKKIYIPDTKDFSFIGLILGPRGVTQRELEKKSGCKISIRGKGSNWNKNGYDKTYQDENEQLHAYLEADSEEQLRKGMALIEPLLDQTSEEHLKQRQNQKMALANLYGFVKEHGCENCGERGHKTWACPSK